MKRPFVVVACAASLLACGGAPKPAPTQTVSLADAGAPPAVNAASEADAYVPILPDDPVWGSRLAPVTIVAFEDFQCPFCAAAADTVSKLQTELGPEKLRVVFKHFPLPIHDKARAAAEAAEGVRALGGNDAFWRFYHSAFAAKGELSLESLAAWAREAGVDPQAIARGDAGWQAKVERDLALGTKIGVSGTPCFLMNGEVLEGAQPLERFEEVAKGEIAKAAALAAKGVAPDLVYAQLTESNLKEQAAAVAKEDDEDAPDTKTYRVPVGSSPVLGAKDALVTIIEFSDFQCPFCKRVEKTLGEVRAKYGADVRFVWKNDPLPFHKRAEPAAELALEARAEKGDKGFWEAHDALFDSQPKLEDADLEAVAASLKLNVPKVKQAIATHKYKTAIEDDELMGDDFGASGTPHFFINGKRLGGAQPLEKFTAIIDEELARAKALKANGTAPAAIYDALVKEGVTATEPEKVSVDAPAASAPSRGAAGAKVVVQEFADFQCPFCKRAEDTVDEVVKAYGGKVKVVWRNFPLSFHTDAQLAAEAALEAKAQKGNDGFWKMHDLLFKNQGVDGGLQRPALDGYAQELKLDMTKWAAALDGHTHQAEIEADKQAADGAKITGTPSFVINGYSLVGAQRYIKFKRVVERALADAAKPAAHK